MFARLFLLMAFAVGPAAAQGLSEGDRINLEAAMAIARAHSGAWPWLADAPFTTLLVAPEAQALVCPFAPPEGYAAAPPEIAGCPVFVRPTPFQAGRIRAFTTGGARPVVIIGSPYVRDPFPLWIGIWLHEHFHQYQMADPGYRQAAEALGLAAAGDVAGRWMVDYAFPFDDAAVRGAFAEAARRLHDVMTALGEPPRARALLAGYLEARRAFAAAAGPEAARFAAFAAWQEGVAEAAEIGLLDAAAKSPPTPGVAPHAFARLADRLRSRLMERLRRPDLTGDERLAFYAQGAAEAWILDALFACAQPSAPAGRCWRARYLDSRFDLEPLLRQAAQDRP